MRQWEDAWNQGVVLNRAPPVGQMPVGTCWSLPVGCDRDGKRREQIDRALDPAHDPPTACVKNVANACILLTLFFASAQIFNSLLPEKGLPFWVFGFWC